MSFDTYSESKTVSNPAVNDTLDFTNSTAFGGGTPKFAIIEAWMSPADTGSGPRQQSSCNYAVYHAMPGEVDGVRYRQNPKDGSDTMGIVASCFNNPTYFNLFAYDLFTQVYAQYTVLWVANGITLRCDSNTAAPSFNHNFHIRMFGGSDLEEVGLSSQSIANGVTSDTSQSFTKAPNCAFTLATEYLTEGTRWFEGNNTFCQGVAMVDSSTGLQQYSNRVGGRGQYFQPGNIISARSQGNDYACITMGAAPNGYTSRTYEIDSFTTTGHTATNTLVNSSPTNLGCIMKTAYLVLSDNVLITLQSGKFGDTGITPTQSKPICNPPVATLHKHTTIMAYSGLTPPFTAVASNGDQTWSRHSWSSSDNLGSGFGRGFSQYILDNSADTFGINTTNDYWATSAGAGNSLTQNEASSEYYFNKLTTVDALDWARTATNGTVGTPQTWARFPDAGNYVAYSFSVAEEDTLLNVFQGSTRMDALPAVGAVTASDVRKGNDLMYGDWSWTNGHLVIIAATVELQGWFASGAIPGGAITGTPQLLDGSYISQMTNEIVAGGVVLVAYGNVSNTDAAFATMIIDNQTWNGVAFDRSTATYAYDSANDTTSWTWAAHSIDAAGLTGPFADQDRIFYPAFI
jgi:hypothetical protein